MAIIGIDLGTTNSLAAVWKDGHAVLIPNRLGSCLTPSVVTEADGAVWVGTVAKEKRPAYPKQSVASFKRLMGTEQKLYLGNQGYKPQELSAMVLRQLKQDAEEYLGEPVEEAVISVPAYFNDEQRYATKQAGLLADLRVERLVNEPSAAALACRSLHEEEDETFLVVDFGGGTLDVSVVACFDQVVEILAVAGDNHLGGDDIDQRIAEHFCREHGIRPDSLKPEHWLTLLRNAEQCKRQLTEKNAGMMEWDGPNGKMGLILTQEDLIRICAPLFKRMEEVMRKALRDVPAGADAVDRIVLVGGTCRMPVIRQYIRHFMDIAPVTEGNPDEIVAKGTAIYAGIKERREEIRDVLLTDICPFTLGVGVRDPSSSDLLLSPVIERNCVLPFSKEQSYSPCSDSQTHVMVHIFQGESMHCSENLFLGTLHLDMPPAGSGSPFVKVRFTYDINGILEVEAVNHAGQKQRKVIVNRHIRMSDEELEEKLRQLKSLNYISREEEQTQYLLARADRLYRECLGRDRDVVQNNSQWLRSLMDGKAPAKLRAARKQIEPIFDYLEEKLGLEKLT